MAETFRKVIWYMRGRKEFVKAGYEAAAVNFNPKDLEADVSQRSFMITGANSGIGLDLAETLAKKGAAAVHLVCRSKDRGEKAREDIISASKNQNVFLHIADMSDMEAIRDLAVAFQRDNIPLHVLVNNAGCMVHKRTETRQGFETNFACNSLGTYLLTSLLIPVLSRATNPRVITVSSGGMYLEPLDADDPQLLKRPFRGDMCYEQQKRQQVVMMEMFALKNPQVGFYSMHPGWADTPAFKEALPDFYEKMKSTVRTPAQGADTALWLAVVPSLAPAVNGSFFQDRAPTNKHLTMAFTSRPMADQERFMDALAAMAAPFVPSSRL